MMLAVVLYVLVAFVVVLVTFVRVSKSQLAQRLSLVVPLLRERGPMTAEELLRELRISAFLTGVFLVEVSKMAAQGKILVTEHRQPLQSFADVTYSVLVD